MSFETSKVFINLPVADLDASIAFYKKLGLKQNKQFSDETAACMIFNDSIFMMLLSHKKFKEFTKRRIVDATKSVEVLNALTVESRRKVDGLMTKALAAGAAEPSPAKDLGFMYHRSFADLDGHVWELVWMNPEAVEG